MRRFDYTAWALALCAIVAALGWPYRWPDYGSDVNQYRTYAIDGGPSHVQRQFAGRILHPLTAHALARLAGIGVDWAFLIIALISLAVFALALAALWRECGLPAPALIPMLCTPFLIDQFWRIYSQGLPQWALIALFFLWLKRERIWIAAAMLFLACIARESALILAGAIIAVGLARGDSRLAAIAAAVAAGAIALTSAAARHSLPNLHHVSGPVFFALKFPFEFARNVLGLTIVPNTLAHSPGNDCTPIFRIALPAFARIGGLSSVSYCGFDARRMLATFSVLACGFGIGPAVLLAYAIRRRSRIANAPGWLLAAIIYGAIAYIAGTSEGTALYDEIGSGWPAFWIGVPALMASGQPPESRAPIRLLACNAAVSWMLPIAARTGAIGASIIIALAIAADVFGYRETAAIDPAPPARDQAQSA